MINVHGLKMNSIKEMQFSKYIASNGIAMNTMSKVERLEAVADWLQKSYSVGDKVFVGDRPAVILQIFPAGDIWTAEVEYRNLEKSIEPILNFS